MNNKIACLLLLLTLAGCSNKKPSIGLEVPFHTNGCSGFSESYSEVEVAIDGLSVVSNIISDNPCYKLTKAEISRADDDVTVYFTFAKTTGECDKCTGVQSLVYKITGEGLNRTGVNINLIASLSGVESTHSFTS